jgi:hypothetical protein
MYYMVSGERRWTLSDFSLPTQIGDYVKVEKMDPAKAPKLQYTYMVTSTTESNNALRL